MRWETQREAVHMPASTGRIGLDQLWLRLEHPTSSITAAVGADASCSFTG